MSTAKSDEVWLYVGDNDPYSAIVKHTVAEYRDKVDYIINVVDEGYRRKSPAVSFYQRADPEDITFWNSPCHCPLCFFKQREKLIEWLDFGMWYQSVVKTEGGHNGPGISRPPPGILSEQFYWYPGDWVFTLYVSLPKRQPPGDYIIKPAVDVSFYYNYCGEDCEPWWIPGFMNFWIETSDYTERREKLRVMSRQLERAAWLQDSSDRLPE